MIPQSLMSHKSLTTLFSILHQIEKTNIYTT